MKCPRCGEPLTPYAWASIPPVAGYECKNCGWRWEDKPNDPKCESFSEKYNRTLEGPWYGRQEGR